MLSWWEELHFDPPPPSPPPCCTQRAVLAVRYQLCLSVSLSQAESRHPDLPGHSNANCSTETSDGGHIEHYLPLTTSNTE